MRGVAARLGVAAMSTYRYVPSKEDLVLHMGRRRVRRGLLPRGRPRGLAYPHRSGRPDPVEPVPQAPAAGPARLSHTPVARARSHGVRHPRTDPQPPTGPGGAPREGDARRSRPGPVGRPGDGQPSPPPRTRGIRPLPDLHQGGRSLRGRLRPASRRALRIRPSRHSKVRKLSRKTSSRSIGCGSCSHSGSQSAAVPPDRARWSQSPKSRLVSCQSAQPRRKAETVQDPPSRGTRNSWSPSIVFPQTKAPPGVGRTAWGTVRDASSSRPMPSAYSRSVRAPQN
ncbi:hypothetical protein AB0M38_07210 [Streptomyces sp. NPDC051742]|uniref:TetR/AcrR family transcriptional regulator n=1 Tax=unclassified Streptomyces TaxID=2593676 RepID=UPI003443500C